MTVNLRVSGLCGPDLFLDDQKARSGKGASRKKETLLPLVTAGAMTGFLELLEDLDEATDLPRACRPVHDGYRGFLSSGGRNCIAASSRMSWREILSLPRRRTFAQANVLERKVIFRQQLLDNIALLPKILQILRAKANHEMPRDFSSISYRVPVAAKQPPARQLELLIGWARYAELIGYDHDREVLYLEENIVS